MQKFNITHKFIIRVMYVAIASVISNTILLALLRMIFKAPSTFSPFFYSSVIELTAGGVIAAAAVYIVMGFIYKNRNRNKDFVWLSIIVLLLSFIPDLLLPFSADADNQGATWPIVIVLMLLHVIPAIFVIWGFTRGVKEIQINSPL